MLAELGHFSLVLALLMAILLAIYPMWGAQRGQQVLMQTAKPLTVGLFLFTLFAYVCLTQSFIDNDFSIAYVAHNSNTLLPWYYRMTAVWGGHEGSFLLWVLIFALWAVAVAVFSRGIPLDILARVLAILGMVGVGFYLYILLASNPFERLLPFYPVDGRDLNPLLQDFGMIIHPPLLYMGYVGFSVVFAFAIAALVAGKLDATWARWSRPWTLAAWVFLTLGIALGSWWAYKELGWGGWWFWDPVENASFMPWLVGTALLHSLAVTEKRKVFKSWTVLLAIAAFSLSLLGTFLVRSGILVSVHSFASDPTRGLFILGLLVLVIGGSLLLYALRAPQLRSAGRYELLSRETMLIGNNILLCSATLVVLMGTLLPLVHKELGLGSISIGAPFFDQMFVYLIVPFVLLLVMGPLSRWKNQSLAALRNQLLAGLGLSLLAVLLLNLGRDGLSYMAVLGMALSVWIAIATVQEVRQRLSAVNHGLAGLKALTPSHWGMVLGHLGFAATIMGIAMVTSYSVERDVRMSPGEQIELQGYEFRFLGVEALTGPNYTGHVAKLDVFVEGKKISHLQAQKRFYTVQRNVMTEAAVDPGFTRDLYVALGEQLSNGDWALRVYVKPYIRWIWGGAAIMALGGLLSMSDKRYRMARLVKASEPVSKLAGESV
ncbi:heme lyase CcmF/NrfE family subunit [Bowmanella denitrificans]|uniref:heme lyase CcmF/NrfE family subunit n=1 Tax=Bowmanella denitrificans TaxID=366582 RepID=UPI000C9B9FFC|nr:heme lyase CcmF/NrfE family subunit [Bowmanella denitrificans]